MNTRVAEALWETSHRFHNEYSKLHHVVTMGYEDYEVLGYDPMESGRYIYRSFGGIC